MMQKGTILGGHTAFRVEVDTGDGAHVKIITPWQPGVNGMAGATIEFDGGVTDDRGILRGAQVIIQRSPRMSDQEFQAHKDKSIARAVALKAACEVAADDKEVDFFAIAERFVRWLETGERGATAREVETAKVLKDCREYLTQLGADDPDLRGIELNSLLTALRELTEETAQTATEVRVPGTLLTVQTGGK
jgi:hypothetical protein